MVETLNILVALATIAFGLFGFLAPRYTASALDLKPDGSNMGLSEIRASVGGAFVVSGAFAIQSGAPMAYATLGAVYAGATLGRAVSILKDAPPLRKSILFLAIEAACAVWLLAANLT